MTDKEVIEDEKCNFKEILQKWKTYNHESTGPRSERDPRRCVSAGQPTSTTINTSSQVVYTKKPKVYKREKRPNYKFALKKAPSLVSAKRTLEPQTFVGRAILRSEYGESKMAETYYTVQPHARGMNIDFKKEKLSPHVRYYRDSMGAVFNFDALVYDLARLYTQSTVFGDRDGLNKLKFRSSFPEASADPDSRPTHNSIWIPELYREKAFPYVVEPESTRDILGLLDKQGAKVVIGTVIGIEGRAAAKGEAKDSKESKDANKAGVYDPSTIKNGHFLQRLAAIYAAADAFPEFCFAYLAGIFAVIDIGKSTPESSFFVDTLRNVKFPQPVGNLAPMLKCDVHKSYSRAHFTLRPVDDALRAAALASVSDPGSPYTPEWQPVVSQASTPKQHLINIMENAKDFFVCWLENCCWLLLPTECNPFTAINIESAPISNYMNALRMVDEPYLEQESIAPWFAIEPTHILSLTEIKFTYGGCLPLGPADLSVVKLPYFAQLSKVKRYDNVVELSLAWHSLRRNLFVWLLSDGVRVNTREMVDIRDYGWENSLPSPLRTFNTHPLEFGVIGIQNDRAGGALDKIDAKATMDFIIWPLEPCDSCYKMPSDNPDRVTEGAKCISNREPANSSEPSLIVYNGEGVPCNKSQGEALIVGKKQRVKAPITRRLPQESSSKTEHAEDENHGPEQPKSAKVEVEAKEEPKKVPSEEPEKEPSEEPSEEPKEESSEERNEKPEWEQETLKATGIPINIRADLESGSEVEADSESSTRFSSTDTSEHPE